MGAVGGMLGLAGGNSGTGYSTPSGTNGQQLQTAYTGAQDAITGQQNLLTALQGQNGLGNQSQVYNQLQNVASGNGPNPAQAMLNQSTGQNVSNQAALMAGQRGAAANPALIARQAAMQGANIQQQAAGQGATMQAQQSLNALNAAGNMANTQAGNQIGQTNAISSAQQNEQGILQGANSANNNVQGQLASNVMGQQQAVIGGAGNAIGAMFRLAKGGMVPMADGGLMEGNAFSGPQSMFGQFVNNSSGSSTPTFASGVNPDFQKSMNQLGSKAGNKIHKMITQPAPMTGQNIATTAGGASDMGGGLGAQMDAGLDMMVAHGGEVSVALSPGEKTLNPKEAQAVASGKVNPMSLGKEVPGKASVKGDSLKNDTFKTKLPEHSVVIPRSVMQSKDPARGAAEFVAAVMAKKRMKS